MVRNWMTSNLLPSEFWYFGLRYAVQVTNMMPVTLSDGALSIPFELAYGLKPDWRNLLPLFSVAYVKRFRDGVIHRKSPYCQTIKAISMNTEKILRKEGQDPDYPTVLLCAFTGKAANLIGK